MPRDDAYGANADGHMTSTYPLAGWAQRLAAVAQTGLTYSDNEFDRQRYDAVRLIAAEMLSLGSGDVGPALAILAADDGYATPKLDTRAIVLRDGELLLVKERSDGCWTPPGGFVDVGEGPRGAVERETWEESGFTVEVRRLLAIFDRNQHPHPVGTHHIWKLFFACELVGGQATPSNETSDVGFFPVDALPPLSETRVTPGQISMALDVIDDPMAMHID